MAKKHEGIVACGAALLDKAKPNWWNGKSTPTIDLETLDLGSPCNCVLGQVYRLTARRRRFGSGYSVGMGTLGVSFPADYGFDIPHAGSYALLRQRWVELIKARRSG